MTPTEQIPNLVEASWEDFQSAGLIWWVNRALHLFGWALAYESDAEGRVIRVFPARCRYRGFPEDVEAKGFQQLTEHLQTNMPALIRDVKE